MSDVSVLVVCERDETEHGRPTVLGVVANSAALRAIHPNIEWTAVVRNLGGGYAVADGRWVGFDPADRFTTYSADPYEIQS